jgi:hypothetical protein
LLRGVALFFARERADEFDFGVGETGDHDRSNASA